MQNREIWQDYADFTDKFSGSARQLAFAGAAVCWFFKTSNLTFPPLILLSLALFVAFFLTDLVQYYVAAVLLRRWILAKEQELWVKNKSIEGDYLKPRSLDMPAFVLFNVKFMVLVIAFLVVGVELAKRVIC